MKKLKFSWVRAIITTFVIASVVLTAACSAPSERPSKVKPTSISESGLEVMAVPEPTSVPEPVAELEPVLDATQSTGLEYVGLPADEVEVLQGQCWAKDPDAPCLPLPFEPTEIREAQHDVFGVTVLFLEVEEFTFAAPFEGGLDIFLRDDGFLYGHAHHERASAGPMRVLELSFQFIDDADFSKTTLYYRGDADLMMVGAAHPEGWIGTAVKGGTSLGDLLFAGSGGVRLFLSTTGTWTESGAGDLTIDKLLCDADGRVVYILSSDSDPDPPTEPTELEGPVESGEYVGLSPDEVELLREQCLAENPDSLCLPLPFEPTGIQEDTAYIEMLDQSITSLVLEVGDYTFSALFDGDLRVYRNVVQGSCTLGMDLFNPAGQYIMSFAPSAGCDTPILYQGGEIIEEWEVESLGDYGDTTKVLVSLGDSLFVGSGDITIGVMGGSPDEPMGGGAMNLTMDDLLRDLEGRLVYVLPTGETAATGVVEPEPTAEPTSEIETQNRVLQGPYVGLSSVEVEQLREQCLAENPDSLCLPLPVDPTLHGFELSETVHESEDFKSSTLWIRLPDGVVIVSPVTVEFESVSCDDKGFKLQHIPADEGSVARTVLSFILEGGLDPVILGITVGRQEKCFLCSPSDPVLQDGLCVPGEEVGKLTVGVPTVSVVTGDRILRVEGCGFNATLFYTDGMNVGSDGHDRPWITLDDLLRDSEGKVVYVLP